MTAAAASGTVDLDDAPVLSAHAPRLVGQARILEVFQAFDRGAMDTSARSVVDADTSSAAGALGMTVWDPAILAVAAAALLPGDA